MNNYSTHLPILERLFSALPLQTVLEFGMGTYSTEFFIKHCTKVTSIEMQDKKWFEKIREQNKSPNFTPILLLGPFKYKELSYDTYNLIFVDGHGSSRWDIINNMFSHTSLIVAHDTETKDYHWEKVILPQNWNKKDIKWSTIWTTIYTPNQKILELF